MYSTVLGDVASICPRPGATTIQFSNDTIHITIQGPRYDTRYDTLLCAAKLVTNNFDHYFQIINFYNNKFNVVITHHQIALKAKMQSLAKEY